MVLTNRGKPCVKHKAFVVTADRVEADGAMQIASLKGVATVRLKGTRRQHSGHMEKEVQK